MSNRSPGQPSAPGTPSQRPDGQPGGMASTADAGLADALQRSAERGDDTATGLASTGNASGGGQAPRTDVGGKNAPGSAPGATARTDSGKTASPAAAGAADQKDESPLESFGRAVSEVVTASAPDPVQQVKRS